MQELIIQKLNKIEQIVTNQIEKPLTLKEAAEYLGISRSYLYKLTATNKIKHHKPLGKMIYFNRVELNEFIYGKRGMEDGGCEMEDGRRSQRSKVRRRQKTIGRQKSGRRKQ